MSPSRLRIPAFVLASAFAAAASAQAPNTSTIAEALFQEAHALLKAGKTHEACEKFAASNKAEPALGTLLSLAACHEREGKTATAWSEFQDAVSQAMRANDAARAGYARQHITSLEAQLHRVVIEILTPVPGVEVKLDGSPLIAGALGTAIPLDPGDHQVEVTAPGKQKWSRTLHMGPSSGTDRIEVKLLDVDAAPAPTEVKQPPPPAPTAVTVAPPTATSVAPPPPVPDTADTTSGGSGKRTAGFVVGGLGVVSLGAAVFFGIRASSLASDRDALCAPGVVCNSQQAFNTDHDARVSQQWMFITGGVGIAAVGVGAFLILTGKPSNAMTSTAAVRVVPRMSATGGGVDLMGAF